MKYTIEQIVDAANEWVDNQEADYSDEARGEVLAFYCSADDSKQSDIDALMNPSGKTLTPEKKSAHIEDGGVNCPHCGSDDISGRSFDTDDGQVSQDVHCLDCDEGWTNHYKLTSVVED